MLMHVRVTDIFIILNLINSVYLLENKLHLPLYLSSVLFLVFVSIVQVCTWIGGVCTIANPYWSLVLWVPKAMSRLWSPSSQSHTAPAKTHLRSPSPSVPSRTSQMPLNTHCRSVGAHLHATALNKHRGMSKANIYKVKLSHVIELFFFFYWRCHDVTVFD